MTKKQLELYNAKYALYMANVRISECINKEDIGYLLATKVILENEIKKLYKEVKLEKQKTCSHPLWYVLEKDFDYGIHSYKCKCLECGLNYGSLVEDFQGKTISQDEIENIYILKEDAYLFLDKEYKKLKNKLSMEDASYKILKKYKRK